MICPNCNTNNDPDAIFCIKCGANFGKTAPTSVSPRTSPQISPKTFQSNRSDLLTLIAILDIVIGALGFMSGVFMWMFYPQFMTGSYYNGYFGTVHMMGVSMGNYMGNYMGMMMFLGVTSFMLIGIPMVIAGLGLYTMQRWGQLLHALVWIPVLLMIPVGTIVAVIAIWSVYTQEINQAFHTPS